MALAYFITFTTYGTWLHGSAKGKGSVDAEHNVFGTPFVEPDAEREQQAREAIVRPPYVMDPAERQMDCKATVQLAHERGWNLLAAPVRGNHVHVVKAADREEEVEARIRYTLDGQGERMAWYDWRTQQEPRME